MPRNPDQIDCIMIKRNAEKSIKVNGQVRLGQAVLQKHIACTQMPQTIYEIQSTIVTMTILE